MSKVRRPVSVPLLPLLALGLAAGVAANPAIALNAARQGINLWLTSVLPCQLPFFILADLLQATGVVRTLGLLLQPLMRPLFGLPGAAGFALAVGFTSGPPGGARAAARLTAEGLLTREEGSRLAGFANAAGPLFVTGVTATSLFQVPSAAPLLVIAHYGAALLAGLILARGPAPRQIPPPSPGPGRTFRAAWSELRSATEHAPTLGHLLARVVRDAGEAVLIVGGFMVFFSVLIGLLEESGLMGLLMAPGEWAAARLGLPRGLITSAGAGIIEITAGLSRIASTSGPLPLRLATASAALAWSGLSIHAQAAAVSAAAGLSYRRFLESRLLQVVLAPVLFYAVWPLAPVLSTATPVLVETASRTPDGWTVLQWSATAFGAFLAVLLLLAALAALARRNWVRAVCVIWIPRRRRP